MKGRLSSLSLPTCGDRAALSSTASSPQFVQVSPWITTSIDALASLPPHVWGFKVKLKMKMTLMVSHRLSWLSSLERRLRFFAFWSHFWRVIGTIHELYSNSLWLTMKFSVISKEINIILIFFFLKKANSQKKNSKIKASSINEDFSCYTNVMKCFWAASVLAGMNQGWALDVLETLNQQLRLLSGNSRENQVCPCPDFTSNNDFFRKHPVKKKNKIK